MNGKYVTEQDIGELQERIHYLPVLANVLEGAYCEASDVRKAIEAWFTMIPDRDVSTARRKSSWRRWKESMGRMAGGERDG